MIIEVFFTCWVILMADGSAYCYCENEQPPIIIEQVDPPKYDPRSRRLNQPPQE